jgi:CheY-like chemotaxis protein
MLTIITGQTELLLNELAADDEGIRQEISEINTVCQRATRLTHRLLAFSRRQTVQPYPLDLNLVIAGMSEMLQRMTGEKIELVIQLGEKLGKIEADPGQMEQVLLNLILNAVDAMPSGGRLTIETHEVTPSSQSPTNGMDEEHPLIQLMVIDTGIGMDSETAAHALEPFFTTKELGQGTGIGLATVDTIVQQCGGWVEINSRPDQGAVFSLYFPRVEDHINPLEAIPNPQSEPIGGHETILLVEDEDGVRMITRRILERHGYRILEADGAQQGLDIGQAHSEQIDLLLSDVIMPGMSGHEWAAQLLCLYPTMKILYMSGYTNEALDQHGVLDTKFVLLEKPFTAERLIRKVRETLDATTEPVQ